jgi:hypothetical protein
MFNFNELKLNKDINESDPFVGIRRSESGDGMEFRLPRGFDDFSENDFYETKKLFFKMYRTFKKFERDHSNGIKHNENKKRKDNIETGGNGYNFLDSEDCEVVLYSKISVIENLLEAYEDLSLDVIERQVGIDEEIDYSKIDRYLDKAIYQEENIDEYVVYIDSMDLPRNIVQYKSASLIDMFCFILHELNNELEQETDSRVCELSSKFKEQHLGCDQSLFNEDTFEETMIALKDILNSIDKSTAYKDNDYWRLYEAVESFLYGELDMSNAHEDGVFWGISNFWQIWEDMCNTYIFHEDYKIIYADTNIKIKGKSVANSSYGKREIFLEKGLRNPFILKFRDMERWLRPDMIHSYKDVSSYTLPKFLEINKKRESKLHIDFTINLRSRNGAANYYLISKEFKRWSSNYKERKKDIEFKEYSRDKFYDCMDKISTTKLVDYCCILDWKYKSVDIFLYKNYGIDKDITKQLCYEICLQQEYDWANMRSQFVIPCFYSEISNENRIGNKIEEKYLYHRLNESKIEVFKANFYTMQDSYLNND